MTALTAQAPAPAGPHPFRGLVIADAAGLPLAPGSRRSRFGEDIWDLSGFADAPVVMSAHRKVLDFTAISNPAWRQVAREYLLARLAPGHPAVATLPKAFRTPINPNTLWSELHRLRPWLNHLTERGVVDLADVGDADCDSFLAAASGSRVTPGRALAAATTAGALRPAVSLGFYRGLLSQCYRPGFAPWRGQNPDVVAGHVRPAADLTAPVGDDILRPLLANAFYLIDVIGPHLVGAAAAAREARAREAASRRGVLRGEIPALRAEIHRRHREGVPAPRLPATGLAQRLSSGWDPDDGLLTMSWHQVVLDTVGAMGHRRDVELLRPELEAWVAECGLAEPWCRDAA